VDAAALNKWQMAEGKWQGANAFSFTRLREAEKEVLI
jgi:hypothetical protein